MHQEMKSISFTAVDVYPSFKNCDTTENPEKTKQCFAETLHQQVQAFFKNHELPSDSLKILLTVNNQGILTITEISSKKRSNKIQKDSLQSFLNRSLPSLYPAQKQGIPVTCSMLLPVVISVDTIPAKKQD